MAGKRVPRSFPRGRTVLEKAKSVYLVWEARSPNEIPSALILLVFSGRPEKRALTLLVREHLRVVVADAFGLDEAPGELPASLGGQLLARCERRAAALESSGALEHAFGRHVEVLVCVIVGRAEVER